MGKEHTIMQHIAQNSKTLSRALRSVEVAPAGLHFLRMNRVREQLPVAKYVKLLLLLCTNRANKLPVANHIKQ